MIYKIFKIQNMYSLLKYNKNKKNQQEKKEIVHKTKECLVRVKEKLVQHWQF